MYLFSRIQLKLLSSHQILVQMLPHFSINNIINLSGFENYLSSRIVKINVLQKINVI